MIATLAALSIICQPIRVVDGDTLFCGTERVRLWGLDSPELNEPGGLLARDQLRRLSEGRVIECRVQNPEKPRDYFGRLVAMCYSGKDDLAREMIRMGPSKDYTKYSRGFYSK